MRKAWPLVALVMAMGCNSATAAEGGREAGAGGVPRADIVDPIDPIYTAPSHQAVVSARKVAPGLYAVRAQVGSGTVTLSVRVTNGSGFATLTSGSEVLRYDGDTRVDDMIQVSAGNRYLIQAIPGEADPMLLDYNLSAFTEIVP